MLLACLSLVGIGGQMSGQKKGAPVRAVKSVDVADLQRRVEKLEKKFAERERGSVPAIADSFFEEGGKGK